MFKKELGDEYHYIFECSQSTNETKLYIDYMSLSPNVIKYNNLKPSISKSVLSKHCKFMRIVNKRIWHSRNLG
jgi:hypothetical protein